MIAFHDRQIELGIAIYEGGRKEITWQKGKALLLLLVEALLALIMTEELGVEWRRYWEADRREGKNDRN